MTGQSIAEEMDYTNFFDQIDDLIDFPIEDIGSGFGANDSFSFPNVWMTQTESFPSSDPVFAAKNSSNSSTELYVPFEEIVQMEWLSSSADNSFSGGTQTQNLAINKKENSSSINTDSSSSSSSNPNQFQSSSPVSILDSTSSNTAKRSVPGKRGRPRTKRPRPTPPSSSSDEIDEGEEKDKTFLCSRAESRLVIRFPKQIISEHKKKKKKNKRMVLSPVLDDPEENLNRECKVSSQQPVRKCMHCEITKTPQWRLGPMGPKTLCNACGVRYKTGRLFPEYRPAASPTFVPSIHSNSHKKVVEMRIKNRDTGFVGDAEPVSSDLPDLIPNRFNVGTED